MNVRLIHRTDDAEKLILFMARVSTPENQHSDSPKLLEYLIRKKHWSPFEMASMCLEVETNRAISAQICRHRSFHFQEFSQRYSEPNGFENINPRRQAEKNRQSSVDDLPESTIKYFQEAYDRICEDANSYYVDLIEMGVSKESARFLLPISAKTKLYMHGTLRDWIHYINLRTEEGVQAEHREIAQRCKEIFMQEFPLISEALEYKEKENVR